MTARATTTAPAELARDAAGATLSSSGSHPFLRSRTVVGCAKLTLRDFKRDERVFHADDMPAKSRTARTAVKDAMSESRHPILWNASVAVEPLRQRTMAIFEHDPQRYAYNFRSGTLPKPQTVATDVFGRTTGVLVTAKDHLRRTQEWEDEALRDKPKFLAGSTLTRKELVDGCAATTKTAVEASLAKTKRILADAGYRSPEARYREDTLVRRAARSAGVAPPGIKQQPAPTAKHSTHAVTCMAEAAVAVVAESASTVELDPVIVAKQAQRLKERLVTTHSHEGTFGYLADGTGAWSCCGASAPDARGCVAHVRNPDRFCLESFCFRSA